MVCVLSFELQLSSYLICQTRRFSLLIRALLYFFMNELLTFFHIVIKRNLTKRTIRETSLVTAAILSVELLVKLLIKAVPNIEEQCGVHFSNDYPFNVLEKNCIFSNFLSNASKMFVQMIQ